MTLHEKARELANAVLGNKTANVPHRNVLSLAHDILTLPDPPASRKELEERVMKAIAKTDWGNGTVGDIVDTVMSAIPDDPPKPTALYFICPCGHCMTHADPTKPEVVNILRGTICATCGGSQQEKTADQMIQILHTHLVMRDPPTPTNAEIELHNARVQIADLTERLGKSASDHMTLKTRLEELEKRPKIAELEAASKGKTTIPNSHFRTHFGIGGAK